MPRAYPTLSGGLWPYSEIIDLTGKTYQGQVPSLLGIFVSDEKSLSTLTQCVNVKKLFFFVADAMNK